MEYKLNKTKVLWLEPPCQRYFLRQFCDQIFLQIKLSNGGGLEVLVGLYFERANWPSQLELLGDT